MTTAELSTLWQDILGSIKGDYTPHTFGPIFANSAIQSLDKEELKISVDNSVKSNFIRKYVEPRIMKEVVSRTGITPSRISYAVHSAPRVKKAVETVTSYEPRLFESAKAQAESELAANPQLAANLSPKLTFKSFIIGNKNRLAFAAAKGVAEAPGTLYNPLYLYGGVGLGKTHIMQAIGNAIIEKDRSKKILYVACENFLNEFVAAIKKGNPDSFKKKYRNIDVFLVDDIQFIAGRDGVQEEFFHTFNALHQAGKQIVMTSDKRPSEIKGLEERLSSRFSAGMVTDLQLPDQSTRLAILQTKCQEKRISLPEHVLQYIADSVETNIRELEGALTTVVADLAARDATPTIEEVRIALRNIISHNHQPARKTNISLLIEIVCKEYGVSKEDLLGACRQRDLVRPRQVLMYLLKHEVGMTYPNIGREIGGRDHTTIMHGVDKVTHELKKNPEFLEELQSIKDLFYEYK